MFSRKERSVTCAIWPSHRRLSATNSVVVGRRADLLLLSRSYRGGFLLADALIAVLALLVAVFDSGVAQLESPHDLSEDPEF